MIGVSSPIFHFHQTMHIVKSSSLQAVSVQPHPYSRLVLLLTRTDRTAGLIELLTLVVLL